MGDRIHLIISERAVLNGHFLEADDIGEDLPQTRKRQAIPFLMPGFEAFDIQCEAPDPHAHASGLILINVLFPLPFSFVRRRPASFLQIRWRCILRFVLGLIFFPGVSHDRVLHFEFILQIFQESSISIKVQGPSRYHGWIHAWAAAIREKFSMKAGHRPLRDQYFS
jgi:hypothetical protein